MDLMVEVAASLHQLNPSYRQVVILRYVENFSVPETAAILGWSEKKVRNSTHRAMLKLRDLLGETSKEVHR
ncbi:sigma factor-like helix-turn-helix DNA-binding protein [Alicyclobacillus contaminans]|uniref:sigma factor-like helix-turn-helix DNA-binding protein n=1 Tax=Alicyclobacillus contaminans TaxID=392016 RepID=UPI0012ECB865